MLLEEFKGLGIIPGFSAQGIISGFRDYNRVQGSCQNLGLKDYNWVWFRMIIGFRVRVWALTIMT